MPQINDSNEQVTINVETLQPVTRTLMTIGALPTSYLISMTYEEQLLWLQNYLIQTVIPAINNNAEATQEVQDIVMALQQYINDYFNNLDVQEEINNKLEQMAQDGSLTNLIKGYVDPFIEEQNEDIEAFEDSVRATISNFDERLRATVSGSPKGTFASIEDLRNANPDTGVYIVTANGHIYGWTKDQEGNPVDLGVYQATGIAKNSIYQEMFSNLLKESFNKNRYLVNFDLEVGSLSILTGLPITDNKYCRTTDFIDSDNDILLDFDVTQYTNTQEMFLFKYEKNGTFINTTNIGAYTNPAKDITGKYYILEKEYKYKLRLNKNDTTQINSEDLNKFKNSITLIGSNVNDDFVSIVQSYPIIKELILTNYQTNFLKSDVEYLAKYVNNTGNLTDSTNFKTPNFLIPCFLFDEFIANSTIQTGAFYDKNYKFISYFGTTSAGTPVTVPENAIYLRISYNVNNNIMRVYNGDTLPDSDLDYLEILNSTDLYPQLNGKTMLCIGDSYVDQNRWQPLVENAINLHYVNAGETGAGVCQTIYQSIERVTQDESTYDFLLIFCGTNDYRTASQLGTINDLNDGVTAGTFYGAFNYMLKFMSENHPRKQVIIITPYQRYNTYDQQYEIDYGLNDKGEIKNSRGWSLNDYVKAEVECGHKFGVPVVNLFDNSGVNRYNHLSYLSDGLHMNTTNGARHFSKKIINGIAENIVF